MEFRLNHTLEHKCKLQIALNLWREFRVIGKICSYYHDPNFNDLDELEFERELLSGVLDSVAGSSLPHSLKADLFETIGSVGQQILKYVELLAFNLYNSPKKITPACIEGIFWTEDGVINKPKSLRHLIANTESIYLENSYQLACEYCIDENFIDELWWKLPEVVRDNGFYNSEIYKHPSLYPIMYWNHYRDETLSDLLDYDVWVSLRSRSNRLAFEFDKTIEENLFRCSAPYTTNEAIIFFYHKIPEAKRQQNLLRCMKILLGGMIPDGEIITFLLSNMNEENRRYMIHQYSSAILKPLLDSWPWREFYIPVFNSISYLTEDMFLAIVNNIAKSIKSARESCKLKLQSILSKIWSSNISKPYKKCTNFFQIFMLLLEAGDIENVVLMSTDKESENTRLTRLAFLIIRVKYVHLLEKFEDLVSEEIKLENFDDESLRYYLSGFLINQDYEAVTKILSLYFENRQNELDTFKSNFPFDTILREIWKNKFRISPTEHCEKALKCIFGNDERKIESAKSNFYEECLFDVYSFLLKGDQMDKVIELINWLDITRTFESNLKSNFVQEYLTETCMKLISKARIYTLNKLVNYLFDDNPKEYIRSFLSNYGVQSCISLLCYTEISDLEIFEDVNFSLKRFMSHKDFVDTWIKGSNLRDTLYRELIAYGNPSNHSNDINITDNIFVPNAIKLRRWKGIDDNYDKFLHLLLNS